MVLCRRLLEQAARADLVLRAASTFRQHHAELVLRLRIGLCGLRQQRPAARRIGRSTTRHRREIGDAARIAGLGGALEQFSRLRLVLRHAGAGAVHHAEFDHCRGAAFVGRLAPRRHRLGHLSVGGVGTAELIQCPPRAGAGGAAEFYRGGDVGLRDLRGAASVGGPVGVGRIGGEPVAQNEVRGLRRRARNRRKRQQQSGQRSSNKRFHRHVRYSHDHCRQPYGGAPVPTSAPLSTL